MIPARIKQITPAPARRNESESIIVRNRSLSASIIAPTKRGIRAVTHKQVPAMLFLLRIARKGAGFFRGLEQIAIPPILKRTVVLHSSGQAAPPATNLLFFAAVQAYRQKSYSSSCCFDCCAHILAFCKVANHRFIPFNLSTGGCSPIIQPFRRMTNAEGRGLFCEASPLGVSNFWREGGCLNYLLTL